ncbi:MAG: hypothetical protein VXW49_08960, partial [Pseudomonadota bacterium]|nr:hypothetical protein [Pseudomonadota bacterium]
LYHYYCYYFFSLIILLVLDKIHKFSDNLRVDLDRALLAQLHYQRELDEPLLERYIERMFDPNSIPYPEV